MRCNHKYRATRLPLTGIVRDEQIVIDSPYTQVFYTFDEEGQFLEHVLDEKGEDIGRVVYGFDGKPRRTRYN